MNQDTQELAKLRVAFTAPASAAPAPEECPSPETLWAAVRGELPPSALREVVDHTARCAACAEDWRLAVEVNRQATAEAETAPGKLIVGRFGRFRPMVTAAALAAGLLVAVGIYREAIGPTQAPTYRESQQAQVRSLLPAGQTLPRQGAVLRWTPVAGATSYDVSVSTEDLRQIATAPGQTAAEYRLPPAALAGLPAGTKLLWRVDAVFPDGHRVTSPTFTTPLQ
jgi:anti-sigma factor RsiW